MGKKTPDTTNVRDTLDDFDVDEALDGFEPEIRVVPVHMKAFLLTDREELFEQLEAAEAAQKMSNDPIPDVHRIQQELFALDDQIEKSRRRFSFVGLPGVEFRDLMLDHPPRKDHPHDKGQEFNTATFPAVLVAAASYRPRLTLPQAKRLEEKLSDGQWSMVFRAAWGAQRQVRDAAFTQRR